MESSVWSRLKGFFKIFFWRRCAGTETPGLLHPVNSIILETETLVPEFCSAIFGFEAGALRRGRARGREPELVCEPELV